MYTVYLPSSGQDDNFLEVLSQLSNRLEHRHLQHLQRDILSSSEDLPSKEIEDSVINLNERIKQIDERKNSPGN